MGKVCRSFIVRMLVSSLFAFCGGRLVENLDFGGSGSGYIGGPCRRLIIYPGMQGQFGGHKVRVGSGCQAEAGPKPAVLFAKPSYIGVSPPDSDTAVYTYNGRCYYLETVRSFWARQCFFLPYYTSFGVWGGHSRAQTVIL